MGGPGGPQQVRDGVGVAGREMGPPLWADVFTLKTENTAVQYPSQIMNVHVGRPRVLRGGKLHPLPLNMFESLINMVAKTFIDAKTAKWINEPF